MDRGDLNHVPWLTAALAGGAVVIALLGLEPAMELDRSAVLASGEVWRLWTGHWAHFGREHLLWDVAVFLGLGAWVERSGRRRAAVCLSAAATVIGVAILATRPDLATYRGLSGLDSALFGFVVVTAWREAARRGDRLWAWAAAVGGLGFLAKAAYECVAGAAWFVDSAAAGFEPVPLAHLVGAVVGMAAAIVPSRSAGPAFGWRRRTGTGPEGLRAVGRAGEGR